MNDFGERTSAESAEGARVIQMLPTWPNVRCNSCSEVYRVNDEQPGFVVGHCPGCGGGRFSTVMTTGTAA